MQCQSISVCICYNRTHNTTQLTAPTPSLQPVKKKDSRFDTLTSVPPTSYRFSPQTGGNPPSNTPRTRHI